MIAAVGPALSITRETAWTSSKSVSTHRVALNGTAQNRLSADLSFQAFFALYYLSGCKRTDLRSTGTQKPHKAMQASTTL